MIAIQTKQLKTPLIAFAFEGKDYAVNDMVQLFYKASLNDKNDLEQQWLHQLELHIEKLNTSFINHIQFCYKVQHYWNVLLRNFIAAAKKFKSLYISNSSVTEVFPKLLLNRLNKMHQQAQLILLYIEV